ncbi:MAG: PspA/IM30 family protein [Verrucomicrobiota bacterium]|nr:PspA/IM30 family protein [Verrucomicrobiota bacterium]
MGIFSRFRDIVNANINALLEKAEDPHAMIKLIIQEMEDTLVEMKATCAGSLAARTRLERTIEELKERANDWSNKARFAMERNREDLAREAIAEKIRFQKEAVGLEGDYQSLNALVLRSLDEIDTLEQKLNKARIQAHELASRHREAVMKGRAKPISAQTLTDPFARFDEIKRQVDSANIAGINAEPPSTRNESDLAAQLRNLRRDSELERELDSLRNEMGLNPAPSTTTPQPTQPTPETNNETLPA